MYRPPNRRANRDAYILFAILAAVQQQLSQLRFTPYVTVGIIGVLVAIHEGILEMGDPHYKCISASKIIRGGSFEVLYLWHLLHMDDMHLYYNVLSFLHKGIQLEKSRGSVGLFRMLLLFAALTSIYYVALCMLGDAAGWTGMLRSCTVGWSGVIFALKAFLQAKDTGTAYVQGLSLPSKFAAWAELIAIQMVSPNASFTGHLAGILSGLTVLALENAIPSVRESHGWLQGSEPGP